MITIVLGAVLALWILVWGVRTTIDIVTWNFGQRERDVKTIQQLTEDNSRLLDENNKLKYSD